MKQTIAFLFIALIFTGHVFSNNPENCSGPDSLPLTFSVVVDVYGIDAKENKSPKKYARKLSAPATVINSTILAGFKIKKDLACNPEYSSIERLAKAMGLMSETKYNPQCKLQVGDLTSWAQKGMSVDQLIFEFAIRKIALDALEEAAFTIAPRNRKENLQGILSAIAREFQGVNEIKQQWITLRKEYPDCKESESTISIPLKANDEERIFLIKRFRLEDAGEMIKNAPAGEFSIGYIQALARYYGLPGYDMEYKCDPTLWYTDDDLNFFYEKYIDQKSGINMIHKELAARRVVIDAADLDNAPCWSFRTLGDISFMAETFVLPKLSGLQH